MMTQTVNNARTRPLALEELQPGTQWVCFDKEKTPLNPAGGCVEGELVAGNPTWGTYQQAVKAWRSNPPHIVGVGREFVREQNITGIDLDNCLNEQGQIAPWAQSVIDRLNSYTEFSPSGKGIHIWVHGMIPNNIPPCKPESDGYEMYDHARYFTFTGKHLESTPTTIEDRQAQLLDLHQEVTTRRAQAKRQAETKKQPTTKRTTSTHNGDSPYGLAALENECRDLRQTGNGARNDQLNLSAFNLGQLVAGGELTRNTAELHLFAAADAAGLDEREIEKTMRSGIENGMKHPRSRPVNELIYGMGEGNGGKGRGRNTNGSVSGPELPFILECLHEGEYGDSRLFAFLFRGLVLYDHTSQEWYTWAGHWWEEDTSGKIKHLVSGKLASVYLGACADLNQQVSQQEAKAEASGDDAEKNLAQEQVIKLKSQVKELSGRAFALRQAARSKNILYFASAHPGMGITADRWDRNPWLLAVPNGAIDLKSGKLRDGRPEDYIRTVCPTEWQGIDAPAPRWVRFWQEIFADRDEDARRELISFLQRLLGYGITGEVREHIFAVLYGEDGRNGKDTIQHTLTCTLGSASGAISKDVLLDAGRQRSAGAPTPHLSDLQGKRLAWANEPEKGARFNVGQIKDLSGGGDIPTRGLHEKKITKIKPSHLLILLTNHKPHADANDAAFWDRIRLITFNMRFVDHPTEQNERKKDPTLWAELEAEASGILAWLVRGCLEWQRQGLDTPNSILTAGVKYRDEEDELRLFLEECCQIPKQATAEQTTVKAGALYTAYEAWAKNGHLYVMNKTVFGLQMGKKKFQKEKTKKGIIYIGIELLPQDSGEELVNSSTEPFTHHEPPPEANSSNEKASEGEQCEQFTQVFSKTRTRDSEFLEKPVETMHTVHHGSNDSPVDQPVERSDSGVNSSSSGSQTIHRDDNDYEEFIV